MKSRIPLVMLLVVCLAAGASFRTTKDPRSTEDFALDWSNFASTGDAITASTWTVPSPLVKVTDSFTATKTVVRLSAGTDGGTYVVTNTVNLVDGQVLVASIEIRVAIP